MSAALTARAPSATPPPADVRGLEQRLSAYLAPEQVARVRRAYEVGALAHEGQTRKSGEPYITHPVAVAGILAELGMDAETIIAAILHDTLEDTKLTSEQITAEFGATVTELVDGVTKLDKVRFQQSPGSRRRKLPQDAAGDGARSARDPDQARRSPAQHAHARREWTPNRAAASRAKRSTSTRRSRSGWA